MLARGELHLLHLNSEELRSQSLRSLCREDGFCCKGGALAPEHLVNRAARTPFPSLMYKAAGEVKVPGPVFP